MTPQAIRAGAPGADGSVTAWMTMAVPPLLNTELSSLPMVTLGATTLTCAVPSAPTINEKSGISPAGECSWSACAAPKCGAGGFEVGRIALGELVDVHGMLAGRQSLEVQLNFYALWRGGERCGADVMAFSVSDLNRHGFGLAERRRREGGDRSGEDKDSAKLVGFHRVIPFVGHTRTRTIMQRSVSSIGIKNCS